MIPSLAAGILFGLSSGLSPGPLLTLVISQTLRHGIQEGVKVALAPLVTDLPVILISMLVLSRLAHFQVVLGVLSFIGGFFLLTLGYESFRMIGLDVSLREAEPKSLRRGALVNVLNPNPYLFWFSVGAPIVIKGWREDPFGAAVFVAGFYGSLVGSKVFIAFLVSKSRVFFTGRIYGYLRRVLGMLLFIFGLVLFKDGLNLLGIWP